MRPGHFRVFRGFLLNWSFQNITLKYSRGPGRGGEEPLSWPKKSTEDVKHHISLSPKYTTSYIDINKAAIVLNYVWNPIYSLFSDNLYCKVRCSEDKSWMPWGQYISLRFSFPAYLSSRSWEEAGWLMEVFSHHEDGGDGDDHEHADDGDADDDNASSWERRWLMEVFSTCFHTPTEKRPGQFQTKLPPHPINLFSWDTTY